MPGYKSFSFYKTFAFSVFVILPALLSAGQPKVDSLSRAVEKAGGQEKARLMKELVFVQMDVNPEEAARWGRQYIRWARGRGDVLEYASSLKLMGDILWDLGKLDSAVHYELQALQIAEAEEDSGLIVECLVILGHIHVDRLESGRAYETYRQALQIAKSAGSDAQMGKVLMSLGSCHVREMAALQEAGEDFSQALDSADYYYSQAIRHYTASGYFKGVALANANKAELARYRGDLPEAIHILKEALVYFRQEGLDNYVQLAQENIARHFSAMGEHDSALVFARRSLEMARKLNTLTDKASAFGVLSDIYKANGDFENAFITKDSVLSLQLQLVNEEKEKAILEMESKYKAEKKDLELARIKEEQRQERQIRTAFIVFFILLAAFMGLIAEGLRIRVKKQKLEAELERVKLKDATTDLAQKKEQLNLYLDQLKTRNKEIKKLSEDIARLESLKNQDGGQNLKRINQLLNQRILTEEDWLQFRNLFDQVHKGFYEKVLRLNDSLSHADLRLLSLCKLGASNQETADTLGISVESVKKGRQRLSQKLNLESARKLDQFVISL